MKYLVGICVRQECGFTEEIMVPTSPMYANEAIVQQITLSTMQAQALAENRWASHASTTGHAVEIHTVIRP